MKTLGVLMLETRFPRVLGDIGNPASFDHPVRYHVVRGASPERVIRERAHGLLEPFIAAGLDLVAQGCTSLTTSCGFLVLFQRELQAALPVPVATSSLLQLHGLSQVGVITIDATSLSSDHLAAAGADVNVPVIGVRRDGEFFRAIMGDAPALDEALLEAEVVEAARTLTALHPQLKTIVLECTNMPPYRRAVAAATGLKVLDVLDLCQGLP
jgi:hypothetical protein